METRMRELRRVAAILPLGLCIALFGLGCVMASKLSWKYASNPYEGSDASIGLGQAIFATECAACHGPAGLGDGENGKLLAIPPTNLRTYIADRPVGAFAGQVAYGKTGNPDMPLFIETLSSEQIWHLTNYVYSLGAVASPSPAVDPGSADGS